MMVRPASRACGVEAGVICHRPTLAGAQPPGSATAIAQKLQGRFPEREHSMAASERSDANPSPESSRTSEVGRRTGGRDDGETKHQRQRRIAEAIHRGGAFSLAYDGGCGLCPRNELEMMRERIAQSLLEASGSYRPATCDSRSAARTAHWRGGASTTTVQVMPELIRTPSGI